MKVLYDSQAFDMQTHGGVSKCFVELYRHLPPEVEAYIGVKETDNVYLHEVGFPQKYEDYDRFLSKGRFPLKRLLYKATKNIQAGHIKNWDRWPQLNQFETERILKEKNIDVFHPTFFNDYFLQLIGDIPFVLTIHDMIPELFPKYYSSQDPQIRMKKKLVPLAAHIVTVSEQTKKDVINILQVPEEKITVVYHGADTTPYYPSVGTNFDFEYLLYIGERHMYKNFISFCRDCIPILRRHRDLRIVCTGKPFTSEELFFFEAFGMKERFIHIFVETRQALLDLYHNAIAFAYPSSYEGFGIPILEAYIADCPIILNRASCFPEIAGDAAIYFNMGKESSDFEEMFESVYHLDSNEREQILIKQRERLKQYSWKKSAAELAQIYQKLQ